MSLQTSQFCSEIDYIVKINGVENPYVDSSTISGEFLRPGFTPTQITFSVSYQSHRDPESFPIRDGDNVKIYQKTESATELIWQGYIKEPDARWTGNESSWKDTVVKTAVDYRGVLARMPFRTAQQCIHEWKCGGEYGDSQGTIVYSADTRINDEAYSGGGYAIRFNAKQRFEEVIPDGEDYTTIDDTDPDGSGKWYYINREAREIVKYIIRNSEAEINMALSAGIQLQFDDSYNNIGAYDDGQGGTAYRVPDEIELTPGTSVLEAIQAVLEAVGDWSIDILPSYYDSVTSAEVEQPCVVFFQLTDEQNWLDYYWASANADPSLTAYSIIERNLSIREKPIANRVIGILQGSGASVASNTSSNPVSRNTRPGALTLPSSYEETPTITDSEPAKETITSLIKIHRVGRIAAAYAEVRKYTVSAVELATNIDGVWHYNPNHFNSSGSLLTTSPYHLAGFKKATDVPSSIEVQGTKMYALLYKSIVTTEAFQLGDYEQVEDQGVILNSRHNAYLKVTMWKEVKAGGKMAYVRTKVGGPKVVYEKRMRKHRTDVEDSSSTGGEYDTPTPFGIVPNVEQYVYDTVLSQGDPGSVPVLGDLSDISTNYCDETQIDKAYDPTKPWQTGDGTAGSGHVITDMEFIIDTVGDMRYTTGGAMTQDTIDRWNAAKEALREKVQKRFKELAYAVTDGSITIIYDKKLLRHHILTTGSITTPSIIRLNVKSNSSAGTHFVKWENMKARIIAIGVQGRCLKITLNDNPILPGYSSRYRKRGTKRT